MARRTKVSFGRWARVSGGLVAVCVAGACSSANDVDPGPSTGGTVTSSDAGSRVDAARTSDASGQATGAGTATADGGVSQSGGGTGVDSGAPTSSGTSGTDAGTRVDAGAAADAATGADAGARADSGTHVDAGPTVDAGGSVTPVDAGVHDAAADAKAGTDASTGTTAANPFGCKFGWGEPQVSGSLSSFGWLQFMSTWVGSEVQADGSITSCSACSWLTSDVASTSLVPAYYAYFVGFYGHANGLPDQNQQPNGPNLATGGGALILGAANSACPSGTICAANKIVQQYAWYAQQSFKAWPTKPLVWLIEGDFIQYTAESGTQTQPLTYAQLGQLATQIASAIKSNMPNAVVAFDDSAWVGDADRMSYWTAIGQSNYDMVWTTGVGNNVPFLNAGETASTYNGKTATYSFLHSYTGKKILVDESAGLSQASDTWSNQPAATLNALIADGVVGINVSGAPSNYQSNVTALEPQLHSTCP